MPDSVQRLFVIIAVFLLWAGAQTSAAHGQDFELSPDLQTALDGQERVRVLVWFALPVLAHDDGQPQDEDAAARQMDAARDAVIARALGISPATLASGPVRQDRPALIREFRYSPIAAMYLSRDEIHALLADPSVARVEIDAINAPQLDTSVGLIGAGLLHTSGQTGAGVSIAVLDSGVDHQHPMFTGRIVESACFSSTLPGQATGFCPNGQNSDIESPQAGDNCELLADDAVNGAEGCEHGTHVAGIAAGADFTPSDRPGVTIRGVAPGTDIVAVQVFSRFTDPATCGPHPACVRTFTSDQVAALEWLYENRAALRLASINMSLGSGQHRYPCEDDARAGIIRQLRAANVATIIASGNDSYPDTVGDPACISAAITVGSTTDADTLSSFSNSGFLVDMVAPGSDILSAFPTANDAGPGRAAELSGTSMATPHVAGAFALMRAAFPGLSVDLIENALESTGLPVTAPRSNFTEPRIRVDQAYGQLAAYRRGDIGSLNVDSLRPLEAVAAVNGGASVLGAVHTVRNTGASPVSWSVSSDAGWLVFSDGAVADGGSAPAAAQQLAGTLQPGDSRLVTVGINASGMAAGAYQAHYEFTVDGAADPLRVAASLALVGAPVNDDFANAFGLVLPSQLAVDTNGASVETGEDNHGTAGSAASVWYQWTAPYSGNFAFAAQGADFDPVVAVYTGSSLAGLTRIAANDNAEPGNDAAGVAFDAVAGQTYYLAVAGANGDSGSGQLVLTASGAPANDNRANARVLSGAYGLISASNLYASKEAGEADHAGNAGGHSVWFSWSAPASGPTWFDANAGVLDAMIAIYDAQGMLVTQGEDETVSFNAIAGTNYSIAVDGFDGAQGVFDLQWAMGGSTGHRLIAAVLPSVRTGRIGQPTTALATVINPAGPGVDGENCHIGAPPGFAGRFSYQTTDPLTNQATGQPNTPVDIPAGGSQTFVFALTPASELKTGIRAVDPAIDYSTDPIPLVFRCENILPANARLDINTFRLTADGFPRGDVVTIAATVSGDGIVSVPLNGVAAFSLSALNIGADSGPVVAFVRPSGEFPIVAAICESNPTTGVCTGPLDTAVQTTLAPGAPRTYSLRAFAGATPVAFAPGTNRLSIIFVDGNNTLLGGTSVAVRTTGAP